MSSRAKPRLVCGALLCLIASAARAQDAPLTLNDALERAGLESPQVIAAEADTQATRDLERQAGFRPNPDLSIEVENLGGSGAFQGLRSTEYTVAIGQRLELGGKRRARLAAARAQTGVLELSAARTRAELGYLVRTRFAEAVAAGNRLELSRNQEERARELARVARVLVEVGREPPLRALRAEANLGEATAAVSRDEAGYLNARRALGAIYGDAAPPVIVPSTPNPVATGAEIVASDSLAVQLAQAELSAAEAAVRRERTGSVPDVIVSAGVRRFEATNDQTFVAGAAVTLPFFNRNEGNVASAQARAAAARARLDLASAQAGYELQSSRTTLRAAEERVEVLRTATVPQAEEALRLAQIGYRAGRFDLIELLAAADARDSAQAALIDAQLARDLAAAALARVLAQ